ncbi:outer membrane beta-barrel protein [uncultured Desulfuromusa sp.]|uniref:surface lipoprotein assembly modifier n=1 Tax=uncultured Desulfuromusa sp. TaxID=219183 RepID=UPI002AA7DFB1|nr:outer membrane beta-barrel protein [uncultured Desulfuromusa sp.]
MKSSQLVFLSFVLSCFLSPVLNAWAEIEIHPRLTIEEEYNDNIFLDSRNEEEDWITTIQPGISLDYRNRSVEATVDYFLRYRFYKNNSDENLEDFKDVQQADATALFFSGRPFTLHLAETISREAIDTRDDYEFSDTENRSTVYHSTVTPEYRLQLAPTFSLLFGYTYDRTDYVDTRGNDVEEHEGHVSLVKQISADSEVFARFAYSTQLSDDDADEFDRRDYTLGISQQLGGRTSLSLEGGYSQIEYDSGFDTDTTNWLIDIAYRLSEPVTLSLGYSQDFVTTAEDGLTEIKEAILRAAYVKEAMSASTELFWNNSDYVRLDREDDAYGVRVDFSRPLARAVAANLDAEYERAEFDDAGVNEDVNRLTFGASLDYEYRRFLASLGYRYRMNESDIDGNDYTNNIITLSATVRF